MIILKKGLNKVKLTLGNINGEDDYILRIKEAFGSREVDMTLTDISTNKNLISKFEFTVVDKVADEDLPNLSVFIKDGERYFYEVLTQSGDRIDCGYLKLK